MRAINQTIETKDINRQGAVSDEGLRKAFGIALLLTGDIAQAESAVGDAIASVAPHDISDRTLFHAAIEWAVRTMPVQIRGRQCIDSALQHLPDGLHPVMQLPTAQRRCFVLRVLVGMSREQCLNLLPGDSRSLNACVAAAAAELYRKAEQTPDYTFGLGLPNYMWVPENHATS